jgi:hypothetical protein
MDVRKLPKFLKTRPDAAWCELANWHFEEIGQFSTDKNGLKTTKTIHEQLSFFTMLL